MLLVGTDVKYASSGNTLNAALTPDLLDAHSIGIYITGSDGKLKLVTVSDSGTGKVLASTVKSTDKITMYQGLGSGNQFTSETHNVGGIQSVNGSVYRIGTAQAAYIGYNPVTGVGDLNAVFYPVSANGPYGLTFSDPDLLYRQQCAIKYKLRMYGNNEFGNFKDITVPVIPTDTTLSIAQKLVAQANQIQPFEDRQDWTASITGNFLSAPVQGNAATAGSGGTIPAATYNAVIVYYGTNGSSIASNEKTIAATGGSSTITFNWSTPPTGTTSQRVFVSTTPGAYTSYYNVADGTTTTLTLTALGSPVAGTVPINIGIGVKLVAINWPSTINTSLYNDQSPYPLWAINVFGVIQNATVTEGGVIDGSGEPYQIRKIEKNSMAYRGDLYTLSVLDRHLPSQVDFSATYDLYQIVSINVSKDHTGSRATTDANISTYVAFVVQGNTLGTDQQADWEDIMTAIFPATSQIS